MPKKFAEEEKAQILARVAEIGAAAAAREKQECHIIAF